MLNGSALPRMPGEPKRVRLSRDTVSKKGKQAYVNLLERPADVALS
jgi:hypothetical protein